MNDEGKELAENTTKQWLQGFMSKYEKDNHTRLNYQIREGIFYDGTSLSLYLDIPHLSGDVLIKLCAAGETIVNWVSGSTTTTVVDAIAIRDLMNVAIEVAQAWAAHCENLEGLRIEIDSEGRKAALAALIGQPFQKLDAIIAYKIVAQVSPKEARLAVEQIMEEAL